MTTYFAVVNEFVSFQLKSLLPICEVGSIKVSKTFESTDPTGKVTKYRQAVFTTKAGITKMTVMTATPAIPNWTTVEVGEELAAPILDIDADETFFAA